MRRILMFTLVVILALSVAGCERYRIEIGPKTTPAGQPTAAPATPMPTVPPMHHTAMLTYDRTQGKALAPNQQKYIADYINEMIFAKGSSANEADVIAAIQTIQVEAQRVGATVYQGKRLSLPTDVAWFVWHSNGDYVTMIPTDVSDVFGTNVNAKSRVWIQIVFDPNIYPRVYKTWECSQGEFWAVALW